MKKANITVAFDEEKLDSRAAPAPRPRRPSRPAPKERPVPSGQEGGV